MQEEWRPIFQDNYEVSNLGNIRRLKKPYKKANGINMLKPYEEKTGYYTVRLSVNSKIHKRLVHRVVAETFIGPCPPDKEVNHKDGNKAHNMVDNLEYLTQLENIEHAKNLGLNARGVTNNHNKITNAQVFEIVDLVKKGGKTYTEIADMYKIEQTLAVLCEAKVGRG